MMPRERPETLALVWPKSTAARFTGGVAPQLDPPQSTSPQLDPAQIDPAQLAKADYTVDRPAFEAVQAAAGWQMPSGQWADLVNEWVAGSMVLLRVEGVAVAAACALRRTDDWIELAWVAVVPAFRGRGLGRAVCAALLVRVLELGHVRLFGSTQDARLPALRIYLDLGFVPVYRAEKVTRWQAICAATGHAFTPLKWGWPAL